MDALYAFAATPEGMLLLVGAAFIAVVLAITAVIFWIGSLIRRTGRGAPVAEETEDAEDEEAEDPLENFDRRAAVRASRAPIALARMRAVGPDITAAAEPHLPGAESAMPAAATVAPVAPVAPEAAAPVPPAVQAVPVASAAPAAPVAPAAAVPPVPPVPAVPVTPVFQAVPPAPAPAMPPEPAFDETPVRRPQRPRDPFEGASFLLTLPFVRRHGLSTAHAEIFGMDVEAVFFDPEDVSCWDEDALRLVPFLPEGLARLLLTEGDREVFRADALCAQPDAVLELPGGLIALEYKSRGGRLDDPLRWAGAMRGKDLIQTVLGALALSRDSGRPAAPVLRTNNAVFFLRPSPELKRLLGAHLAEAETFLLSASEGTARPGIAASDYAELLQPALERIYPRAPSEGSVAGEAAHAEMLRRS